MKEVLIIVLSIVFSISLSAQEITPIPWDGSLDMYVGTWKYENTETDEVFIIKLKKFDNFTALLSNFGTVLIGEYYHSKNGIILYDNLDYVSTITTNNLLSIFVIIHDFEIIATKKDGLMDRLLYFLYRNQIRTCS